MIDSVLARHLVLVLHRKTLLKLALLRHKHCLPPCYAQSSPWTCFR